MSKFYDEVQLVRNELRDLYYELDASESAEVHGIRSMLGAIRGRLDMVLLRQVFCDRSTKVLFGCKRKWWLRTGHNWDYVIDQCGTRPVRVCTQCDTRQSWIAATRTWQ